MLLRVDFSFSTLSLLTTYKSLTCFYCFFLDFFFTIFFELPDAVGEQVNGHMKTIKSSSEFTSDFLCSSHKTCLFFVRFSLDFPIV
jgi:hypothetical protein